MSVVVLNEETDEVVVYLDGVERGSHVYEGRITDHPLSDGSTRADGRTVRPRTLSLSGLFGVFTVRDGQLTGDARADEVESILRELQVSATPLAVQFPGRAQIESMGLERFSVVLDAGIDSPFSADFKELRTASRRQVLLEPVGSRGGGPREDIAPGVAETEERGTLPNKSLGAAGIDALLGLVGGG